MALVVKDRVKETTATTGTGTLTLAGAVAGFQTFTSVLSNGDTTYYGIFESSTGEFEVGLGTFTSSGTTLARTTILESSNSGSAINLTAGAADVFITQPAEKAVYLDASGYIATADGRNLTNVDAATVDSLDSTQFLRSDAADTKTSGNLGFSDNVKVLLGTGSDVEMFSDGTNGVIRQANNSGGLYIQADNFVQFGEVNNANPMLRAYKDGAVDLYYDYTSHTTPKLSTTATGININGDLNAVDNIQLATAMYHEGDTNTFLSFGSGGDSINLATGGSTRLTVSNSNVTINDITIIKHNNNNYDDGLTLRSTLDWGYGTSLSFDAVTSSGGSNGTVGKIQSRWQSAGNHALDFYIFGSSSLTQKARLDATGLAINTTTVTYPLTVKGTVGFQATNSSNAWAVYTYTDNTFRLNYNGSGSDEVVIDSSGRVMIGTTTEGSPDASALTVSGAGKIGLTLRSTDSDRSNIYFSDATSGSGEFAGYMIYDHPTNELRIGTSATQRVVIESDGDVGIGGAVVPHSTSYASATLHLRQENLNNGSLIRMTTDHSGHTATDGSYIALWTDNNMYYRTFEGSKQSFWIGSYERMQVNASGIDVTGSVTADNIYVAGNIYHEGDTDTYIEFNTDQINIVTANGTSAFFNSNGMFTYNGSVHEFYSALSGTTPTCDPDAAGAFSLTMTGNTTFTFGSTTSGYAAGFVLQLTGNGSTVTWPASVDWAGGTAPDAPASGETDILVFITRDGGTNWYGALAIDAAA